MFSVKYRAGKEYLVSSLPLEYASVVWGLEVGHIDKSGSEPGHKTAS